MNDGPCRGGGGDQAEMMSASCHLPILPVLLHLLAKRLSTGRSDAPGVRMIPLNLDIVNG